MPCSSFREKKPLFLPPWPLRLWQILGIYTFANCFFFRLFSSFSPNADKQQKKGNVFVIAAIILERNLQNVANYLVASLAVADLFVACLVMPLGAVYEVSALQTNHLFILLPFAWLQFIWWKCQFGWIFVMETQRFCSISITFIGNGNIHFLQTKIIRILLERKLHNFNENHFNAVLYRLVKVGYSDRSFVIYGHRAMSFVVLHRYYIWWPSLPIGKFSN